MNNNINLGDQVKDTITGFTGVVVSQATFLNGCARINIQSQKLKEGVPTDPRWFDTTQIKLVKANAIGAGPPLSFPNLIELGDRGKDRVTGYQGIVVGRTTFLSSYPRVCLQSEKLLPDGQPTESQWFDEPQVELIKARVAPVTPTATGGPLPYTPQRSADPRL